MIERYRKKPMEVEAVKLTADNANDVSFWCGGQLTYEEDHLKGVEVKAIYIPTLEGVMLAVEGDYVIKGIKGEFYPCKPDIFEESYDLAR